MKKFDKLDYDKQYRKNNKVQLNIDLNPEEKTDLIKLIQKNGFKSNREFLLECIKLMKSEKNPFAKKDSAEID